MPSHTHLLKSVFGKVALAAAALSAFLFFAGAPAAQAHDRDDYGRGRYEDSRRHEAFEHRGYVSRPDMRYFRAERPEAFERGWFDRYGYWHRY
jgi:hypothetical protein